ncbi:hypothetical protein [Cyanobium sp. WAJ14-Wanaka]|uniref:hypothetical protein n=1 Tax=Cyanobium sp. WAJ14-Wanaka TaxID=2823725 RepID=UPI0029EAF392|nr:hypothetical protein [Cyanobium sp. WAJ14-Wanaka]
MRQRFLRLTRKAIAGELDSWSAEPSRALALVLLLADAALPLFDQFTDSPTVDVVCRHRDVIAQSPVSSSQTKHPRVP